MDRIECDRRARHARQLRKFIIKQRMDKMRLSTTQINSSINETYGVSNDVGVVSQRC